LERIDNPMTEDVMGAVRRYANHKQVDYKWLARNNQTYFSVCLNNMVADVNKTLLQAE
jgi:hypothetical protein